MKKIAQILYFLRGCLKCVRKYFCERKETPLQVFSPANHMGFAGENTRKGGRKSFRKI